MHKFFTVLIDFMYCTFDSILYSVLSLDDKYFTINSRLTSWYVSGVPGIILSMIF